MRFEFGFVVNVYVYVLNGDNLAAGEIPLSSEK